MSLKPPALLILVGYNLFTTNFAGLSTAAFSGLVYDASPYEDFLFYIFWPFVVNQVVLVVLNTGLLN